MTIGKKKWAIAEGYIPEGSTGPEPQMESHETICILNAGGDDAKVEIMVYFTDRNPEGPFPYTIESQRTKHIRLNSFVPKGIDFSTTITSSVPIVVQHTRLDSRQAENALLSTIAFSE